MADQVQEGDKVSWNWNGNRPGGTVAEVKAGEVSVTSHRGNEIKKMGNEDNPAVRIERSGNDVVKKASELNIDEKGPGDSDEKQDNKTLKTDNELNGESKGNEGEPKIGDKRKADEKVDANGKHVIGQEKETETEEERDTKKQRTDKDTGKDVNIESNNGAKKRPGRPKSNGEKKPGTKKEKRVPAVGKSERKTRSQGAV